MKNCIVCCNTLFDHLYDDILKCRGCGFVFANIDLSNEELSELYRREYFFGEEYKDYLGEKNVAQRNFRLRLRVLERFLQPSLHRRLLEVGCAYGLFLDLARQHFPSVRGVDITTDGINYCREELHLDVVQGDLTQLDWGEERFDVACMWDTIEHLRRPDLTVERLGRLLSPNGLLAITTGDIGSWNARLRGRSWRLIHPPTHLHYFSLETLERLLRRFGFDVIYRTHCGFYRSLDTVLHNILVLRAGRPSLYERMKRTGIGRLRFYLNLHDILFVIARKSIVEGEDRQ